MKIVIVRLDLDRYDLDTIERLVADGIVSVAEAMESEWLKGMSDWDRVLWVRKVQVMRPRRPA